MAQRAAVSALHTSDPPRNSLLASVPHDVLERLTPDLTTISVEVKDFLHRQGHPIEYVYFPNDGVASITITLANGSMVEAATVGNEGMLGFEAFLTPAPVSQGDTLLQVPGPNRTMERLGVEPFRRELRREGALQEVAGRYAQTLVSQMMLSSACNALHPVHERCCRWLLQTHDRIHADEFQLSHEFLAIMLGVRRQSVTVVAGALQRSGLISYVHGRVSVRDRPGLEAASCECYAAMRAQAAAA